MGLPLLAKRLDPDAAWRVARVIAVFLVTYRIGAIPVHARVYGTRLVDQLPLQICGVMFLLCAVMLWKKSYRVFEIAYFWGLAGTFQAMVTPDVRRAFPDPEYLIFFFSHTVLVVAIFYATFVFGFRPRPASIAKAFGATLAYAAFLTPINWLLDANFMYLRAKPAGASLLDALGPWPWYLVGAGALAVVLFTVCYLPFLPGTLRRRAELERQTAGA